MTNIEMFAHIIDLANRTSDSTTYSYLMRGSRNHEQKSTLDIDYCDFRFLIDERLKIENQSQANPARS